MSLSGRWQRRNWNYVPFNLRIIPGGTIDEVMVILLSHGEGGGYIAAIFIRMGHKHWRTRKLLILCEWDGHYGIRTGIVEWEDVTWCPVVAPSGGRKDSLFHTLPRLDRRRPSSVRKKKSVIMFHVSLREQQSFSSSKDSKCHNFGCYHEHFTDFLLAALQRCGSHQRVERNKKLPSRTIKEYKNLLCRKQVSILKLSLRIQ